MRHAFVQNGQVRRVYIGDPHPQSRPVVFEELSVSRDTHHITLKPASQWEVYPDKVVATYAIEERDLEAEAAERARERREYREGLVITRFQARAALHQAGLLQQAESIIQSADKFAQIAWQDASEFRRTSPTLVALAPQLGLDDAGLDELFEQARQIEA